MDRKENYNRLDFVLLLRGKKVATAKQLVVIIRRSNAFIVSVRLRGKVVELLIFPPANSVQSVHLSNHLRKIYYEKSLAAMEGDNIRSINHH